MAYKTRPLYAPDYSFKTTSSSWYWESWRPRFKTQNVVFTSPPDQVPVGAATIDSDSTPQPRSRDRDCLHTVVEPLKIESTGTVGDLLFTWPGGGDQGVTSTSGSHMLEGTAEVALTCDWYSLPNALPSSPSSARYDALKSAKPGIQPGMSLPNFLWELKDFSKMFNLFDTKHSVRSNLENGILNFNFGIAPFVRDLVGIYDSYQRVGSFWDHVVQNKDNIVVRRGKGSSTGQYIGDLEESRYTSMPDFSDHFTAEWRGSADVSYDTMVDLAFTYDCLDTETGGASTIPADMFAKSVLQAFNFCLDPKIIWDGLPFSFVADWFFPIGDALHDMAKDTFVPGCVVHKCILHEHTETISRTDGKVKFTDFTNQIGDQETGYTISRTSTQYDRSHASMDSLTADPLERLEFTAPSGKQAFLGLVLGSTLLNQE